MIVSHLTYHVPHSVSSVVSGVPAYLKIQQLSLCQTLKKKKKTPTSHHVDILTSTSAGDDTTVSYKIILKHLEIYWLAARISSVQFSCSVVSNSFRPHRLQHTRPPCPSPTPGLYSDSHPSSQWCHPAISSSVVPFSRLQSFLASGSFQMCQFLTSTEVSTSASVLPMNIQGWSPLGWTGWISLESKGLSRVFSNTIVKSINSSALSFLHSPTLTSIRDYWKNHSFD